MVKKKSRRTLDRARAPGAGEQVAWFREHLLAWFERHGRSFPWREPGRSAYEIVVAEVLLQRTTANSVARAYTAFLDRYPSWPSLAGAAREELREALRPLGLWRQKADVLLGLAQSIGEGGGAVPASRSQLERLKGVGQYTASAVLAAVHAQAVPLVDVNTARVLGRFFGLRTFADISRDPHLHSLALVAVDCERSLTVSWAILDLGALVCRARRPLCPACPLRGRCAAFAGQEATDEEKREFPFGSRAREQNQEVVPGAVPVFREE